MSERTRFFRALFSGERVGAISNVRFFLGMSKFRTPDEVYKQAADAIRQFDLGVAEPHAPSDKDVERVHIEKFLAT